MNIVRLPQRVEIIFWRSVILLMQESDAIRLLVKASYENHQRLGRLSHKIQMISVAAAGLGLGFVIGYLVMFFQ